jgi:hypothetical protein
VTAPTDAPVEAWPAFWDATQLGRHLYEFWPERGWAGYVYGVTVDRRHALIVTGDDVTIASVAGWTVGRWECSASHLARHSDIYAPRFPVRVA